MLGGESAIASKVAPLFEAANPTAAIYCKTGECEIRITARAKTDTEAETMCRAYAKKFYDLLGDAVYDEDVAGLEETVVHTLRANGLTIATALVSWWKNNSFTPEAIEADDFLCQLKEHK